MHSPFEHMVPVENASKFEIINGAFDCSEMTCEHTMYEAKYSESDSLLTWKCPDGHVSSIEGYSIV